MLNNLNQLTDLTSRLDLLKYDNGSGVVQSLIEHIGQWHDACRAQYQKIKIQREQVKLKVR